MNPLIDIRGADCHRVAESLIELLDRYKLQPNPTSDLAIGIAALSRVPNGRESIFCGLTPNTPESRVAIMAFAHYEQFSRLAAVLARVEHIEGFGSQLRHILKRMNRLRDQSSRFHAAYHELATASRMVSYLKDDETLCFAEPDILVMADNAPVLAVACKRVASESTLVNRIREACAQIQRHSVAGFAVIDLEGILHSDQTSALPIQYQMTARDELGNFIDTELDRLLDLHQPHLIDIMARHEEVIGVTLCGFMTSPVLSNDPGESSYSWSRRVTTITAGPPDELKPVLSWWNHVQSSAV